MVYLFLIAAVILIILLFPVNVNAEYVYSQSKKQNIFKVSVFGIRVFKSGGEKKQKKKIKQEKMQDSGQKMSFDEFRSIADKWRNDSDGSMKRSVERIFKNLKRFADLRNARCLFEFGFGDAAVTGIASGIIYGVVYDIFAKLYYYFNIKKKNLDINVTPDFTKEQMELYLKFGFKARIIFALLTAVNVIKVYFRLRPDEKSE